MASNHFVFCLREKVVEGDWTYKERLVTFIVRRGIKLTLFLHLLGELVTPRSCLRLSESKVVLLVVWGSTDCVKTCEKDRDGLQIDVDALAHWEVRARRNSADALARNRRIVGSCR